MRFEATDLKDAVLVHAEPKEDERGSFARLFCRDTFRAHGLEADFPQHSVSYSREAGTLRGMHFQREPWAETKLVRCLRGAIFDVIIDLRSCSPTFRHWQGFELSADNAVQLYVPEGFAHGFITLCAEVSVNYLISRVYVPDAAAGVRYDDPAFGITWPVPVTVIADKDREWPDFVV
ncbi:MAG: dTDP-4-dehydrorhamnose 3,5-epimerase [Alphaproteobacteria bacterium]|nr:dTDP-4-dehydrorhamnose 3,5-epimerase [Alphaproteobacteria bacterium]